MENLEQALKNMKGKYADIYISHQLFGDQYIKIYKFIPVVNCGYGFECKGQQIYFLKDEILNYEVKKYEIVIKGPSRYMKITQRA